MTEKRVYSAEFKVQAVELAERSGKTIRRIEADLGITPGLLNKWKRLARQGKRVNGHEQRTDSDLVSEVRRLRRELAEVSEERDILKKTIGILAQQRSK